MFPLSLFYMCLTKHVFVGVWHFGVAVGGFTCSFHGRNEDGYLNSHNPTVRRNYAKAKVADCVK